MMRMLASAFQLWKLKGLARSSGSSRTAGLVVVSAGLLIGLSCRTPSALRSAHAREGEEREASVSVVVFLGPHDSTAFTSVTVRESPFTIDETVGWPRHLVSMVGHLQEVLSQPAAQRLAIFVEADLWIRLQGQKLSDEEFWVWSREGSIFGHLLAFIEGCSRLRGVDLQYSVLLPARSLGGATHYIWPVEGEGLGIAVGKSHAVGDRMRIVLLSMAYGMGAWGMDTGGDTAKRLVTQFPAPWGDDEVAEALRLILANYDRLPEPSRVAVAVRHGLCVISFDTGDEAWVRTEISGLFRTVANGGRRVLEKMDRASEKWRAKAASCQGGA